MKKKYCIGFITISTFLLFSSTSQATNGYQLIGIGSYQKSLAGAVTALPGSNMTAVTNPAGMIRIGPRADFSMEAFMPERSTNFTAIGGAKAESSSDLYGIPAIGWNGPVGNRDDLVFGGGMYGTSGMGVDYGSTFMAPAFPPLTDNPVYWDGYSSIAFWQMAPALAWQATEKLSLGVSFNIDFQQVSFQQRIMEDTNSDQQGDNVLMNFDLSRGASAFGFGITLGLLYDITDMVSVGASYKSKQFFSDLEYQLAYGDINIPDLGGYQDAGTYSLDMDFPQQAAIGIALHATNTFTVAGDVKWINWSDTMDKLAVAGPGGIQIPMNPGWDDQIVFALGIAYKVNDRFNLRAGFNYSESPIDESNAANNLILPAVVETHYTIGADYRLDDQWDLGFHYMYVPENTVTTAPGTNPPGVKISLSEQSIGINLGYRF